MDLFLAHRFEGTPLEGTAAVLAGMALREQGTDLGIGYRARAAWGTLSAEVLRNVDDASDGSELRLRYEFEHRRGQLRLWPQATLAWRDAKLNNYYYGVRAAEATAARPAYDAGAGLNLQLALYATYPLSRHWQVLAGVAATQWSGSVRNSPIAAGGLQSAATLGMLYEHSPQPRDGAGTRPLWGELY